MKAAEKIISALTDLLDGYCELQEQVEDDFGAGSEELKEGESELNSEVDTALVTEVRAAIESVIEAEDYSPEEIASVISALTDALQEIDPDVFGTKETESEEDEEDFDDDEDDEDYDEDELDEDE